MEFFLPNDLDAIIGCSLHILFGCLCRRTIYFLGVQKLNIFTFLPNQCSWLIIFHLTLCFYMVFWALKINVSNVSCSFMLGPGNTQRHLKSDVEVSPPLPLTLYFRLARLVYAAFWQFQID